MEDHEHDDVLLEMSPTGKPADRVPVCVYPGEDPAEARRMAVLMLLVTLPDNPKEAAFLDGKRLKPTKAERAAVAARTAEVLSGVGTVTEEPIEVPTALKKPRKVANASKAKPKGRSLIARIRKRTASRV